MEDNKHTDALSDLLVGVGAIAEVSRVFYTQLVANGFDEQQALYLTSNYIVGLSRGAQK